MSYKFIWLKKPVCQQSLSQELITYFYEFTLVCDKLIQVAYNLELIAYIF